MTKGLVPTGWYLSPELGVLLPPVEMAPPVPRVTDIEPAEPAVEPDVAPAIEDDPPIPADGESAGSEVESVPPAPEVLETPGLVEGAA
jgi:hypothetical protein